MEKTVVDNDPQQRHRDDTESSWNSIMLTIIVIF